jgi:hypothetical protein
MFSTVVGIEVLTLVVMKSPIFWDVTPCSLLENNRHFGGAYRLHLQGRRISQARNQHGYLLHAGFLFGLFVPEDEGNVFLRNVA